jgi:ketosteroid isomerase-like protein
MKIPMMVFQVFMLLISCNRHKEDLAKAEIMKTEQAFAQMVSDSGITKAFVIFAADSGVILRGKDIIKGKQAIKTFYENQSLRDIRLHWIPDFIDVSSSGDLGYTYGSYQFSAIDSSGDTLNSTGIFHSVWKKQTDGTWRFVWD